MVKTILLSLLSLSVLSLLTGCGEEAKTKEYYSQHIEQAKTRAEECKKLEKFNETQQLDCQNARSALFMQRDPNSGYKQANDDMRSFAKLPGAKESSSK